MKKNIFFLLVFCSVRAFAQIPEPPKTIPSPNAYSFNQYTNIPVSHFTGLPQISIPLAIGTYKDLKIPIEFSYHNSGFKPEQHPGWVGLGWSLNVGGVITRTVRGEFPDEFDFNITPDIQLPNQKQATRNGYIYNTFGSTSLKQKLLLGSPLLMDTQAGGASQLYIPLPHKLAYYPNGSTRLAPDSYKSSVDPLRWLGEPAGMLPAPGWFSAGGKRDVFSDEYNFNFMGISGKFMLQGSGGAINLVVQCNQKVKIEIMDGRLKTPFNPVEPRLVGPTLDSYLYYYSLYHEEGTYPKTFSGFVITTDNGNKYYFGKNAEMLDNPAIQDPTNEYFNSVGIEYSINTTGFSNDFWTADSWYLTRILYNDGRKIDFEYQRKEFVLNEYSTMFSAPGINNAYSIGGKLISPVYLKRISSDFFECDFFISKSNELRPQRKSYGAYPSENYTDFNHYISNSQIDWYKLDSLVMSGNGIGKKRVKMEYNDVSTERLFLKKIIEHDGASNRIATEFSYNNSKTLPNYFSSQTDHWGYWNGKSVVGLDYTNLSTFTASKESDFAYTIPGALTKIKYPTGGEANFEYEQNTFSKAVPDIRTQPLVTGSNQLTGGVRLYKTTHYDLVENKSLIKKYFYTGTYNPALTETQNKLSPSSGISTRSIKYEWDGTSSEIINYYATTLTYPLSGLKILSDQSITPMFDSYHVNYSKVHEIQEGNGYSSYSYSDFESNPDESYISILNNIVSPYTRFSDKGMERGLLKEVANYDQQNTLVQKSLNTYKADRLENGGLPFMAMDEGQTFITSGGGSVSSGFGIFLHALGTTSKFYTHRYLKDTETSISYRGGMPIASQVQYFYENPLHGQVTRIETGNSKGEQKKTYLKYAMDLINPGTPNYLLSRFESLNYLSSPLQKINTTSIGGTEQITSGELYEYNLLPSVPDVAVKRVYQLNLSSPLALSSFGHFTVDNFGWDGIWTKDSRYREVMNITKYDVNKNILVYKKDGGTLSNGIGYDAKRIIPTIIGYGTNDSAPKYAFESFEDLAVGFPVTNSVSRTGSSSLYGSYVLNSSSFVGLEYVFLDLWANGTNVPIVTYNTSNTPSGSFITQVGSWKLYRYALSNYLLPNITINANGSYVDDVKILPLGAIGLFNTYTYKNGLLVASSNERDQLTFYEYDGFGRLKVVKDQNGNITKAYDYNYKP